VAPQADRPVEVFISYSHKDDDLRAQLETSLVMLRRRGVVRQWSDRRINPGQEWDKQIDEHLESADCILLLVSPDFLVSDYCYDIEVARAMQRHEAGEARVIPIILRFTDDWQSAPFGRLQALPKDAQPVKDWPDRDKAFADVAAGIRRAVEELLSTREERVETHDEPEKTPLPSLIPRPPVIGFVSRRDPLGRDIVARLKEELAPGRTQPVTLSGPGGIGKTTLAAEAARSLQEAYKNRLVWSSADGRPDFTLLSLLDEIATQLGRAELRTLAPAEKEEQVRSLAADALVVLDNYETVSEAERARVEAWFKRTQCSALFTSRPKVPGTVFVPVSAMSREEGAEFLEKLTAQTQDPQLFTPEVRESVYVTAEANPYVMQWVVAQIDDAKEPATVFEELAGGVGDAAERVFARSFDLPRLGDDGRAALLALSLFAPNASREALSAVAGLGEDRKWLDEAAAHLHALWLVKGVDGNRRLAVEGLTRTLAAARLSKDPRADEFRRRFVVYFLRYALERHEPTPENYNALEAEKENLLGAAETAYTSGEWDSVMRMAYALSHPVYGMLSVRGYWDEAVRLGEQALHAARSAKDAAGIAILSHNVAVMYTDRGELAEARRLYEESLEIEKRLGDQSGVANTTSQLGIIHRLLGEFEEAKVKHEESLAIRRKLGEQQGIAIDLHQLGRLAEDAGDKEGAARLFREALGIFERLGSPDAEIARRSLARVEGEDF
jgi:tetratricopeptide (TPR) repeat protein